MWVRLQHNVSCFKDAEHEMGEFFGAMNGVSQYEPMLQARYTHAECRIPWAGFLKSCMNSDSTGSTFEAAT